MTVWHEISDHIWVRRYAFFDQTIGVVGGADGLLVIDTRTSHRQGEELRTDLRELPGAVRWVVNTHHHHDHCFGNAVFGEAELWGHERSAARLVAEGEALRAELLAEMPDQAEEWREPLEHSPSPAASARLPTRPEGDVVTKGVVREAMSMSERLVVGLRRVAGRLVVLAVLALPLVLAACKPGSTGAGY